jgi:hypothetical protein
MSLPAAARAQWSTTYEQFYLPGKFNWQFRHNYPAADRLFNAFDFGHAILYETLWTDFRRSVPALEEKWYNALTREILVHPPRVPLEEAAIEIAYAKLAPEAKQMFDWAHLLHRQIYDVWADERIPVAEKDAKVAELVRYYKTRRDLAFSSHPKTMVLMQEQPYSLAFRKGYPKFNGLIWAYHWLQVGLYEPLVTGGSVDEKQAGVRATVARFWQMLQDAPRTMPYVMPMTAAVSPAFAKRYPEAAIIFDNLHSMHDVVSDILANPDVTRDRKRAEIMLAARRYRDDTSFVMSEGAWRTMAQHMGVENMGGVAGNPLPPLPTPTVTIGAVMTHDDRTGEMTGFSYGEATGGAHAAMQPAATPADSGRMAPMDHSRMTPARDSMPQRPDSAVVSHAGHAAPDSSRRDSANAGTTQMQLLMELQLKLLSDPVTRARIVADTAARRLMLDLISEMPVEHRAHLESLLTAPPPASRPRPVQPTDRTSAKPADPHAGHGAPAAAPAAAKPAPTKPAAKPTTRAAPKPPAKKDSMAGMDHSKMTPPKKP